MGIRAVTAMRHPTSRAYGIFKRDMATKNMVPRITASTHWPVMKLENTRWLRLLISSTRLATFSGSRA